jgi:potassium-transporting ATPase KdpC subunit
MKRALSSVWRDGLRPAVVLLLALVAITGLAYPAAVTVVTQLAFPGQANGSLIVEGGRVVGSSLIGQAFDDDGHFHGRPSAAGAGYDAMASSGSNLGPTSRELIEWVGQEVERLRSAHGDAPVPVDLVTTSASGLDPHISPAAADYQVARVAAVRGMSEADVRTLVARHTEGPILGFLGQPRVHVLHLNLALDEMSP